MIKDLELDYHTISVYIDGADSQHHIKESCDLLNWFWLTHCEHTTTYWFLITVTKTNARAIGLWKSLRDKINGKIRTLGEFNANF